MTSLIMLKQLKYTLNYENTNYITNCHHRTCFFSRGGVEHLRIGRNGLDKKGGRFMIIALIFASITAIVWGYILQDWLKFNRKELKELERQRKEVERFQEMERPYIDPKVFNEVMRHQQEERIRMYKGRALK